MKSKVSPGRSLFFSLLAATVLTSQAIEIQDAAAMNTQEIKHSKKDNTTAENKNTNDKKEKSASDAEMKKRCDMARKNLTLLKSKNKGHSFRTSENAIVRYSPYQIEKMIKDNETVEQESCK